MRLPLEKRINKDKTCKHCGKIFSTWNWTKIFCTSKCAQKNWNERQKERAKVARR